MPRKLRTLNPIVRVMNTSTTRLPPKAKDPVYNTDAFKAFRVIVLKRAGYKCERCGRGHPDFTLYADHIRELIDGGSLTDPNNGMCLCASCHQHKTMAERVRRHQG
jgi:5-methylcytosine-specific restriction enzyme A